MDKRIKYKYNKYKAKYELLKLQNLSGGVKTSLFNDMSYKMTIIDMLIDILKQDGYKHIIEETQNTGIKRNIWLKMIEKYILPIEPGQSITHTCTKMLEEYIATITVDSDIHVVNTNIEDFDKRLRRLNKYYLKYLNLVGCARRLHKTVDSWTFKKNNSIKTFNDTYRTLIAECKNETPKTEEEYKTLLNNIVTAIQLIYEDWNKLSPKILPLKKQIKMFGM